MSPLWFSNLIAASAQIALLVVLAALLPRLFCLRQPRVLLAYWTAILAACLLLPLLEPWRVVAPRAQATVTIRTGTITALAGSAPPMRYWPFSAYQVVAVALLAGIVVRLIVFGMGLIRLRGYRREAEPLTPLPGAVQEIQARTQAHAAFGLSRAIDSPVTFGLARPVILLPERFPALGPSHQATIACHELVHVRRHDWAQHVGEECVRALLWFHPAIHWLIARIRVAREQVVDFKVLELTGARRAYLEALLEIAAGGKAAGAVPAPPFLVENQLAERVALMLKEVSMSRTRLIASLAAMLGCVALAGTLAVSSFPLKAQAHATVTARVAGPGAPSQTGPASNTIKPCRASDADCPQGGVIGGVIQGTVGGMVSGVTRSVVGGVVNGVTSGVVRGVGGGIGAGIGDSVGSGIMEGVAGGVSGGVAGGISGGVPGAARIESQSTGDAQTPKLEHAVPPEYPPLAKLARIGGDVVLTATVDEEGNVTNLEVVSGHPLLVKAALDAVRQWKYSKPAVAPVHFDVTVHFDLGRENHAQSADAAASKAYEQAAPPSADEYLSEALAASEKKQALSLKPVKTVNPVYPEEAKANHIEGNVVLSVTLNKSGRVSNVEVLSGPKELAQAAIDAVRQWEFEPPAITPAVTTVTINFVLGDGPTAAKNVYRVGGEVKAPKLIIHREPPYTDFARKAKIQGSVQLVLVVDAEGNVTEAKVVKALDPGLDESAVNTVRTWKFQPATRGGKPVPVKVTVEVNFKLR